MKTPVVLPPLDRNQRYSMREANALFAAVARENAQGYRRRSAAHHHRRSPALRAGLGVDPPFDNCGLMRREKGPRRPTDAREQMTKMPAPLQKLAEILARRALDELREKTTVAELPKLYTESEVATYLGVDEQTVARERRRGRLGYTRVAKKIRFTDEHIREYLRNRECTATPKKKRRQPELVHLRVRRTNRTMPAN